MGSILVSIMLRSILDSSLKGLKTAIPAAPVSTAENRRPSQKMGGFLLPKSQRARESAISTLSPHGSRGLDDVVVALSLGGDESASSVTPSR